MRIVVLDGHTVNPGDLSWQQFEEFGEVAVFPRTRANETVGHSKGADILLTNKVVIDKNIMDALPGLKYIGVLATGYNVVDVAEAAKRGIVVTNIPAYSTDSVAQMMFAHLLNITNRIGHYATENRQGRWSGNEDFCYWDTPMPELSGKTLGIVGLGNIGLKVAEIARAFGMDVFAFTHREASSLPFDIHKTTLDGLLSAGDIITLHCPLSDKTFEMINRESIAKMKQGAILINTGRGQLVNEHDVAEALASGRLAAYGADVMGQEPPSASNPLLSAPNAFITPHIAWATFEARGRLMTIAANNVKAFIEGQPVNVVNG